MRYGTFILALGALWSSQVSAGELQSVYVAPGGVYIASANVYLRPENGGPAYTPGYVPPGQGYRAPAFYGTTRSVYPARPAYVDLQSEYRSTYATEFPPRPPAPVPYGSGGRCVTKPAYGPPVYCD